MPLPLRKLGSQGLVVPCIGYGAMGSTAFYGASLVVRRGALRFLCPFLVLL
jgi:hypothetical protein